MAKRRKLFHSRDRQIEHSEDGPDPRVMRVHRKPREAPDGLEGKRWTEVEPLLPWEPGAFFDADVLLESEGERPLDMRLVATCVTDRRIPRIESFVTNLPRDKWPVEKVIAMYLEEGPPLD